MLTSAVFSKVNVAIIDSGVDIEHRDFVNSIWVNSDEIPGNWRDDDGNLYPDDINGWNFPENKPEVIDRKYIGTFSNDPYKFFDIQAKRFFGLETEEDKKWLEEKRKDKKFAQEMQKFGNFVHGTHVAGIALNGHENINIQAIKLIPTEIKPFISELVRKLSRMNLVEKRDDDWRKMLLSTLFGKLAEEQSKLMIQIAEYIRFEKIDIANGSFGSGYKQLSRLTDPVHRLVYGKKPTEEESKATASLLIAEMVKKMKIAFQKANETLFIFAAGNDGMSNDEVPVAPANIQLENSMSVAATYNDLCIAPFSNFGTKMVDIAAPGMIINSQIPGNEYLKVSGTSQAAPFVAHVAAAIKSINPKLTPVELKKILMETTDIKSFLKDKVKSSGLVNLNRAKFAAELTLTKSIQESIAQSLTDVKDIAMKSKFTCKKAEKVEAFPLFPSFR
jgi:subtilisin family serine protease